MNPDIVLTPEQKQQLGTWVNQRDTILAQISVAQIENDKLIKANKELAISLTNTQEDINKSLGRLGEMTKKEEEFENLTDIKIVDLSSQKAVLETKIEYLQNILNILEPQKKSLEDSVSKLTGIYEELSKDVGGLEKEIGDARQINSQTSKEIGNLLVSIKGEFQKIIDVNTDNVEKTNVVINQLPRIIFDLQKDIFERKQFNRHKVTPQ